jgi:hypothetical protein
VEPELNPPHPQYDIRHVDECPAVYGGTCNCFYEYAVKKIEFFNNLGPDPDLE